MNQATLIFQLVGVISLMSYSCLAKIGNNKIWLGQLTGTNITVDWVPLNHSEIKVTQFLFWGGGYVNEYIGATNRTRTVSVHQCCIDQNFKVIGWNSISYWATELESIKMTVPKYPCIEDLVNISWTKEGRVTINMSVIDQCLENYTVVLFILKGKEPTRMIAQSPKVSYFEIDTKMYGAVDGIILGISSGDSFWLPIKTENPYKQAERETAPTTEGKEPGAIGKKPKEPMDNNKHKSPESEKSKPLDEKSIGSGGSSLPAPQPNNKDSTGPSDMTADSDSKTKTGPTGKKSNGGVPSTGSAYSLITGAMITAYLNLGVN